MTDSNSATRRRIIVLIMGIVAVLLITVGFWWNVQRPPTGAGALRLIDRKNVAVGLLENIPNDSANDGSECVAALATQPTAHLSPARESGESPVLR